MAFMLRDTRGSWGMAKRVVAREVWLWGQNAVAVEVTERSVQMLKKRAMVFMLRVKSEDEKVKKLQVKAPRR